MICVINRLLAEFGSLADKRQLIRQLDDKNDKIPLTMLHFYVQILDLKCARIVGEAKTASNITWVKPNVNSKLEIQVFGYFR